MFNLIGICELLELPLLALAKSSGHGNLLCGQRVCPSSGLPIQTTVITSPSDRAHNVWLGSITKSRVTWFPMPLTYCQHPSGLQDLS